MSKLEWDSEINVAIRGVEEARRISHRDVAKRGELIDLLHALARLRVREGDFRKAESLYREALACIQDNRKTDPEEVVKIYTQLACFYDGWGKSAEAMEYYAKALDVGEKAELQYSSKMAELKNHLARIYKTSGQTEKAVQFYEEAMEGFLVSSGEFDVRLAYVYDELGVLYYQNMELERSLNMHLKSLLISENFQGNHDFSQTCLNLSSVYRALGEFEKAYESSELAAQIKADMTSSKA